MILLDEEYYSTRFPKFNNGFESLSDNEKNTFLNRYSLYMNYLYNFLITETSIKNHDAFLKNNKNFTIPTVDEKDKDMYQYLSKGFLEYYYIRNNLNLFCLSNEQLSFLDNRIKNNNYMYDNDAKEFIMNTFREVICEPIEENTKVSYGPADSSYFHVLNGSLVIGQRYDEYVTEDLRNSDNQKKYFRRAAIIERECQIISEEISDKLFMDVRVLRYVDETVQKKESNSNIIMNK